MKVQFDSQLKIAGIGLVPWTRLGPEQWFDAYRIASMYGWDMGDVAGAPPAFALSDFVETMPDFTKLNTPNLLANEQFQQLLKDKFAGYSFMTYKPVTPPPALTQAGCTFISMDQGLAQKLENKAAFRRLCEAAGLGIPFPEYKIIERASVAADANGLRTLLGGREAVVLQDEALSGGKGTHVIRDLAGLQHALDALQKMSIGRYIVVSDLIEGAFERSVQCCVTRYGVMVGPLQKQIVADPLLSNLHVIDGDRFCGGEISAHDLLQNTYTEIRTYALAIGEHLAGLGYRGIFGVDCLIGKNGQVYVLEVNPRITGLTPLLTMLYRDGEDIPFSLLHMLELSGADYQITDHEVNPTPNEGSLFILHSQGKNAVHITESLASGIYRPDGSFVRKAFELDAKASEPQILMQRYRPPKFTIKPGGRLMSGFANQTVLDAQDELLPEFRQFITKLLNRITLEEAHDE